jgi:hypothetical protein
MEFAFAAMMGWCGTRVPGRPPIGPDPDPEPWWRTIALGVIGAVAGVIVVAALGNHFASAGMFGTALLALGGGRVGADIVGGVMNMGANRS